MSGVNVYEIALGALLHDIGKFMQRAFPPGEGLSDQTRGMENLICPVAPGWYATHQHVLYTREFLEQVVDWLPEGVDRATVADLASFHHRPDTAEQRWIAEADRLSAGIDRRGDEAMAQGAARRYRDIRLISVAAGIGEVSAEHRPVYALRPLTPDAIFPVPLPEEADSVSAYRALWDQFVGEWRRNRCGDPFRFIARALSVLERYTWCIPSATNVIPDVALYDHMRSTAAIAVALAGAPAGEEKPFLLAAGDLTGIQKYIFGFKMGVGGLARRLRARSFNVNAFTQALLLRILRELNLPMTQVILMAGGKFHLLLPNTSEARACLERTGAEATEWLYKISGGETSVVIASLPCDREELWDFSRALAALHQALREERARTARSLLIRNGQWAEDQFLRELNLQDGLCDCCGRQGGRLLSDPDGEVSIICGQCEADEETGARLPKARYIAFFEDCQPGDEITPAGRIGYKVLSNQEIRSGRAGDALVILDLDSDPAPPEQVPDDVPLVWQVWARYAPRDKDGGMVDLRRVAERSTGVAYLGCLKMDVDDLGWMFAQGLRSGGGADRVSLARVAALSRLLELFFRAYLERLLKQDFPDVYLVYSGGDDVLALGPWNQMFALARRIREDFRRVTGGNPLWKLSAGVALVQPGVPVLLAAEQAEELLEASKQMSGGEVEPYEPETAMIKEETGNATPDRDHDVPAKDRITAFRTVMRWDAFGKAVEEGDRLREWLADGTLNTARVRRLLWASGRYRAFQRTRDTRYLDYVPTLVYDLRRNWKENAENQKAAKRWAAGLISAPDVPGMHRLRFVTEYALYGARNAARASMEDL